MWAVYPNVRDPLFNLNGLAHKVVFDAEFSYADANENFDELPLYDPLDDTSIIEMPPPPGERRVAADDHSIPSSIRAATPSAPACRTGSPRPSAEIADDLMALRMGMRQRWQTKRGVAGNQHIVDWLTFDMNATLFPDANRDNFGQEVGLIDYDLRWHLGDRFSHPLRRLRRHVRRRPEDRLRRRPDQPPHPRQRLRRRPLDHRPGHQQRPAGQLQLPAERKVDHHGQRRVRLRRRRQHRPNAVRSPASASRCW